jgi:hypothetical protein
VSDLELGQPKVFCSVCGEKIKECERNSAFILHHTLNCFAGKETEIMIGAVNWTAINKDGDFLCLRCGKSAPLKLPASMEKLEEQSNGFKAQHCQCKEKSPNEMEIEYLNERLKAVEAELETLNHVTWLHPMSDPPTGERAVLLRGKNDDIVAIGRCIGAKRGSLWQCLEGVCWKDIASSGSNIAGWTYLPSPTAHSAALRSPTRLTRCAKNATRSATAGRKKSRATN